MICSCSHVLLVAERYHHNSDDHSDNHTEERQTADPFTLTTNFLKADWEGAEEHVKRLVDDGHVDREYLHDGFPEEQEPGTYEGCLQCLASANPSASIGFCWIYLPSHGGEFCERCIEGQVRMSQEQRVVQAATSRPRR